MPTSKRACFLLAVIVFQILASLGSLSVRQRAGEWDHLLFHNQAASEHHHADQTLHLEPGEPGVHHGHVHADTSSAMNALLGSATWFLASGRATSPRQADCIPCVSPVLDGLLRPPKRLA